MKSKGFTIVELLIVIVVIGILAAITIVSFNGVTKKAAATAAQSELSQNAKVIMAGNALNGQYSTADVMNGTVTTKFDASKYKVVTYCATASDFILAVQTTGGDKFYKKMNGAPVQDNTIDAFAPCTSLGLSGAKTTYLNLPSACATETTDCAVSKPSTVVYGSAALGSFNKINASATVTCSNTTFADPAIGSAKSCYVFPN